MMSKSAGETPKDSPSQSAKPGAAQPHETVNPDPSEVTTPSVSKVTTSSASKATTSSVSKETFLQIKVRKGASLEEIVGAVEDALRTVENPFFQLYTPAESEHGTPDQEGFIPCGKALSMTVKYEGPYH
jgi:hypothetical protein